MLILSIFKIITNYSYSYMHFLDDIVFLQTLVKFTKLIYTVKCMQNNFLVLSSTTINFCEMAVLCLLSLSPFHQHLQYFKLTCQTILKRRTSRPLPMNTFSHSYARLPFALTCRHYEIFVKSYNWL